jgi:two-component system, response regulator PdtaR
MIESALIVSCQEKETTLLKELLNTASVRQFTVLDSCESAGRLLLKQDFDLVIVNSPLRDESGERFSRYIAGKGVSQVMLLVKNEFFDSVCAVCEDDGVLTVSKPLDKVFLWPALSLAKAAQNRIKKIQAENTQLKRKIEDIRIIDRAKCTLISFMNMSEQEAHRYIEKQAMDMRSSRRIVAEGILKRYEN